MCGISGVVARSASLATSALGPMVLSQAHRGPDGQGLQVTDLGDVHVGFGHRRLAIIDLTETGQQPMTHPVTGDVLIYNGELYNHLELKQELEGRGVVFRGSSDTEVILHALVEWGPECVDRLKGMFAFAFLWKSQRRILLARDPLGIKPLYFATLPGVFAFASEVRSLVASGLVETEIDRRAMAGLLAYGAVQEPYTIFKQIRALEPGTVQMVELYPATVWTPRVIHRWSIPEPDAAIDERAAVETLRKTLDESVRDHLISDVPVGVFLSAGIDSTIIASLAARHNRNLRTFTVGFADNPDLSESEFTGRTAADLGLQHTDVQVTGAEAVDSTKSWLSSLDQPSMDGFNVYLIAQAVRAQGIKVALSGQGGDELFGGYASFRDVPNLVRTMSRISWLGSDLRGRMASMAMTGRAHAVKEKAGDLFRTNGSAHELYLQRRRLMSDSQLAALGIDSTSLGLHRSFIPQETFDAIGAIAGDPVATVSRLESRLYMGNMLLRDGDANGMAHGLEIRVPFLDRRMLEMAYRIPGKIMLPEGKANKHLLRQAFGNFLRPELATMGKRGFILPIRRWMCDSLRPMCEEGLESLKTAGFVEKAGVDAIWQRFLGDPESQIWSRAFTLCVLGMYLKRQTQGRELTHRVAV